MVSDRRLDVHLDGLLCGNLLQTASGDLRFEYDPIYRRAQDATPLSLSMPLAATAHRKRVALPFFQGLLPDSLQALESIGRRFGVSPRNPFAILEHVGAEVAGAVQVLAPGTPSSDASGARERIRPADDSEVESMLTRVIDEYRDGAPYSDDAGRFSLAGAQPKIALHRLDDGSWGVPEDGTPTTHILKPVVGVFRRIDVVEQLTLDAARRLGCSVAASELRHIGRWPVLISRRYDRARESGRWRRLHQEDLCQSLAVAPAKKYQDRDGGPGVADIARLIRSIPLDADRRAAAAEFFTALVFNVVSGATDAHAKNYSLLLDGRGVRLAPLYDLLSYAAYWDGESSIRSAMSIGGEYSLLRITPLDLVAEGRRLGLGGESAEGIVETVRASVAGAFEAACENAASFGPDAEPVADALLAGLRKLPLVL